jgi:hypothetical protein
VQQQQEQPADAVGAPHDAEQAATEESFVPKGGMLWLLIKSGWRLDVILQVWLCWWCVVKCSVLTADEWQGRGLKMWGSACIVVPTAIGSAMQSLELSCRADAAATVAHRQHEVH